MSRIASFYERRVFPHLMDRVMQSMAEHRAPTLASAHGEVLEIGFGTGLNLPHYPTAVRRLSTVDPLDALPARVQERIAAASFPVERHHLPADGGLPFESACFDTVTVTWTLCSIPEPQAALREMRRVLKPRGRLLFIEHGRADSPGVARWQDRLNGIQRVIGCGCNLNRSIDRLIEESGFVVERLERFVAGPRLLASLYRGSATGG